MVSSTAIYLFLAFQPIRSQCHFECHLWKYPVNQMCTTFPGVDSKWEIIYFPYQLPFLGNVYIVFFSAFLIALPIFHILTLIISHTKYPIANLF